MNLALKSELKLKPLCHRCHKSFSCQQAVQKHLEARICHQKQKHEHICPFCHRNYSSRNYLLKHHCSASISTIIHAYEQQHSSDEPSVASSTTTKYNPIPFGQEDLDQLVGLEVFRLLRTPNKETIGRIMIHVLLQAGNCYITKRVSGRLIIYDGNTWSMQGKMKALSLHYDRVFKWFYGSFLPKYKNIIKYSVHTTMQSAHESFSQLNQEPFVIALFGHRDMIMRKRNLLPTASVACHPETT